MEKVGLGIDGALQIQPELHQDTRGVFYHLWDQSMPIAQACVSVNIKKGTLRGMHMQLAPHAESKWVSCLSGEVYDVLLDLRMGSSTYGQWQAVSLSAANRHSVYIPAGVAHGFQTLSDDTTVHYLISENYQPGSNCTVHYLDEEFAIEWPLAVTEISDNDSSAKTWQQVQAGLGGHHD